MKKIRKRNVLGALFILIIIVSLLTNPTKQDYINHISFGSFSEEKLHTINIEIERINFYLFSTYAEVKKPIDEYGAVHLGIMGNFFQISDVQDDYPWWLEFFNGKG